MPAYDEQYHKERQQEEANRICTVCAAVMRLVHSNQQYGSARYSAAWDCTCGNRTEEDGD